MLKNLTQNIYHTCIACPNRAIYSVFVEISENTGKTFYACDSDNCDALVWLQTAPAEEIFDYDIEN